MISHRRQLFRGVLLSTLLLGSVAQAAGQEVRVGAYHFPPYAIKPESATPAGLLPELLAALNRTQSDYHFSLVPTSVTRRYSDLQSARFDLILFESPAWGWKSTPHQSADLHIEDAEVYVARQEGGVISAISSIWRTSALPFTAAITTALPISMPTRTTSSNTSRCRSPIPMTATC